MRHCYARVSRAHPTIPLSELEAIAEAEGGLYRLVAAYGPLALLDCSDDPDIVSTIIAARAGYTRRVGLVLGFYEDEGELLRAAGELAASLGEVKEPVRVEAHRWGGLWRNVRPERLAVTLASILRSRGVRVSPRGSRVLEILYIEGFILAGLVLRAVDLQGFHERSPGKRPFFKPGPLDPFLSRALVNLARLRVGSTFWDPFCGTGGMALEACLVGSGKIICGDIDPTMARGAQRNLRHYGCSTITLCQIADAAMPPVAPGSVSAVATDPPYGRSTTLGGRGRKELYKSFLERAAEALVRGSYIVFAAPADERVWVLAEDSGFRMVERHYMYVHGSLTREIVVARRV